VKRVLVLGAGPAGLSAAARLLERGQGEVQVRVVHAERFVGGKAASWRDADGHVVEHGWHMLVGFYDNLFALMARAGIRRDEALRSMAGDSHCYEPWSGKVHTMNSGGGKLSVAARFASYDGLPRSDRFNFARVMTQAFAIATSGEDLTRHDDVCFDTWAVEQGLRRHVTRYSIFRFLRLAYFNFPEQISAYHVLQTLKLMSTSEHAELFVCRSGTTEALWAPIAAHVQRLGGTFEPDVVVTDWMYEGDRIRGVRSADGRTLGDFDYVLSTLPVFVLQSMNASDTRMWRSPFFRRLSELRGGATLSLTLLTQRPVPQSYRGPLHGLPAPLNFVVDMKPYWDDFTYDSRVGSVLVFGGHETGFESWSDADLVSFTLEKFTPVLGDVRALGILKTELHRNRAPSARLFISEPGVEQFRPDPITPFRNLFLAGDWVRNRVSVITMEGAVTSGMEAADLLLERVRSHA
jgi:zeta-carotene desaturase